MARFQCGHCFATSGKPQACTKCNREMCSECISDHPDVGPVCGLCKDRLDAQGRYQEYCRWANEPLPFDEWYDRYG